ncbi:MAG TPA: hypothetical protein VFT87_00640 [Candidatus Saccharimonadales bacterium]|nr:hypothetical protein [Candidatus Saccharimonadales bacterium]
MRQLNHKGAHFSPVRKTSSTTGELVTITTIALLLTMLAIFTKGHS